MRGQRPSKDTSHVIQDGQSHQAPALSLCSGLSRDQGYCEAEGQGVPWYFWGGGGRCGLSLSP